MTVNNQGWRHWARYFEGTREFGDRWPDGHLPNADWRYLFVDGVHSSSHVHWIYAIEPEISALGNAGRPCGFSYAGLARPYTTRHTRRAVNHAARLFADEYLTKTSTRRRVVPVAFSLGTVVTLLAVRRWLHSAGEGADQALPALVLLAPAHSISPLVLNSYQEYWQSARGQGPGSAGAGETRLPRVVRDLADPYSYVRREAADAFAEILDAGIDVYALYWPNDAIAPYTRPQGVGGTRGNFEEVPVRNAIPLSRLAAAVREHRNIRDDRETTDLILDILSKVTA